MKTYKCFIHICSLFISMLLANSMKAQRLELKDLNIPNAPAIVLLDQAPTLIDRPGTSKALTASIISLLTQGDGLPRDFAIEVAPYWFFKNKLNVYRYLGIDSSNGKQTNIFSNIRNASFSVGSVNRDSSRSHRFDASYLSAGLRFNPVNIVRKNISGALTSAINAIALRQTRIIPEVVLECSDLIGKPGYNACLAKALSEAFSDDRILASQEERLRQILKIRPAFQIDIALAGSMVFRNKSFNQRHGHRTGIWTTMAYNIPLSGSADIEKLIENKNYINLFAAVRYLDEDESMDFVTFGNRRSLDVGGRFELEFDKFSMSFESLHRFSKNGDDTNRNVGIVQYKINDHFYVSGSFGKNFGSINNLIALFGLNWGFGSESIVK